MNCTIDIQILLSFLLPVFGFFFLIDLDLIYPDKIYDGKKIKIKWTNRGKLHEVNKKNKSSINK